ncbi:MAG TPA: hypothetical protein VHC69_06890 [Polyangiaceae bacterium]|nr:hypothetical protein [Polyangiaceae bacterium]
MAKRVSIAVCLTLGAAFVVGAGCSSIPDHREILSSSPDGGGTLPDGGQAGGFTSSGGASAGGGAGASAGGGSGMNGSGGKGSGGDVASGGHAGSGGANAGGSGNGGQTTSTDGGPDAAVGLPCGANHCLDRPIGHTTYPACCTGPKQDRCGVDTSVNGGPGCLEPDQAGALDSICTDMDSTDGSTTYPGCCRPDGKCGVIFEMPGGRPRFGCEDPTELGLAAGKDCTPAACTAAGRGCTKNADCCPGTAGDPVCMTFGGVTGSVCSDYCVTNRDCASGCCLPLVSGRGACALDAKSCSATCRQKDEPCDTNDDCCSPNFCAPNSDLGPRLCRPKCTTNADCSPGYCVKDDAGQGECTAANSGLCSDTCHLANDGMCQDGATYQDYDDCALGTDCSDCGGAAKMARVGGTSNCTDTCSTHNNKKCEDGGPGAALATCPFGTDCTDCGPRLGICSNVCEYTANDGTCDDGGIGANNDNCAFGTDCADCGVRYGGRGQGLCDGSKGTDCVPTGGIDSGDIEDGTCQCPDCPWDEVDCKVTVSACDGKTLGACCAPTNPCHIQFDGICACGGWCDWEQPDCGNNAYPALCDGQTIDGCDYSSPNPAFKGNGKCDCQGFCSWEASECTAVLGTTNPKLCSDTCKTHDDGYCDDDDVKCTWGTDCADCGIRFPQVVK